MILGVIMVSIAMAGQAFAGGFSQSCKDFSLDYSTLKASCKQEAQAVYRDANIDLDSYIGNNGGILVWGGKNFDKHCDHKQLIQVGYGQLQLRASCKNAAGTYGPAQINLDERISNMDGHLKYDN